MAKISKPDNVDTPLPDKPKRSLSFLRWLHKLPRRTKIVAIIFLIIATIGAMLILLSKDKLYGQVGGHKVTVSEIKNVSQSLQKAGFYPETKEQIGDLIMNYWLYTLMAEKYDLKVNDKEAIDYFNDNIVKTLSRGLIDANLSNKYVYYRAYVATLRAKLTNLATSPQTGAYIIARFDQNYASDTYEGLELSQQPNQAKLANDKKYATDFINNIHSKLKSGSLMFDEAIKLQYDDPRIGLKALPTAVHSSKFPVVRPGSDQWGVTDIAANPQIQDKIKNLKAGQITDPFIVKAPSGGNENSIQIDSFWVIAKVDSVSGGQQFSNLDEAVDHFKQEFGYEVYNK